MTEAVVPVAPPVTRCVRWLRLVIIPRLRWRPSSRATSSARCSTSRPKTRRRRRGLGLRPASCTRCPRPGRALTKCELRTRRETVLADWLHYDFPDDEIWARGDVTLRQGIDWITTMKKDVGQWCPVRCIVTQTTQATGVAEFLHG